MPTQDKLSSVKYGSIELMMKYPFNKPTKEVFESWKKDFLKLEDAKSFDIYLVGTFSEKLHNDDIEAKDVDIVLIGEPYRKKIEKLIYEGTKLGFEKYNTFFDIQWFSVMPDYDKLWDTQEVLLMDICVLSPELTIDGVNINSKLKKVEQVSEDLWQLRVNYPTRKQVQRMSKGFRYSKPQLIN